ncbi:MAG: hypothetical protein QGF74_02110 [Candidatus Nanoarchaeia archaeon]|jgi:hypothetical protein|nr:hypothetical protein [Candidatus Nanoarchaeia archaeon]|tara:strand:- start:59122 stop:59520 length:399 start_codon:yes stop_codon:yes gene_type:complete
MKTIKGVEVKELPPVNPGDLSKPTFELWKGVLGRQVTLNIREKGTPHKLHYHTGKDPSKDPERIGLIVGKARLYAENNKGETLDMVIEAGKDNVIELVFEKGVRHDLEYLSLCIILEYRETPFNSEELDMRY